MAGLFRSSMAHIERLVHDDDPATKSRNVVAVAVSIMVWVTVPAPILSLASGEITWGDPGYGLWWVWIPLAYLGSLAFLFMVVCGVKLRQRMYVLMLSYYMICAMLFDWHQASGLGDRAAPLFVIIFDCLLIGDVRRGVAKLMVAVAVVWMLAVQAEYIVRYGLFDSWGTMTVEYRRDLMCTCSNPPCVLSGTRGVAMAVRGSCISLFVFVVDFVLTRRFALRMKAQEEKVRASVRVALLITASLARFDLATARRDLAASADQLPDELHESLNMLLANMQSYRPYLPQSLLMAGDAATGKQNLSVVFSPRGRLCDELAEGSWNPFARSMDRSLGPLERSLGLAQRDSQPTLSSTMSSTEHRGDRGSPHPGGHTHYKTKAMPILQTRTVTLLLANLHHTNARCEDPQVVGESVQWALAKAFATFPQARGVVDLFLGDRIFVSFNASHVCVSHAARAIGAAKDLSYKIATAETAPLVESVDMQASDSSAPGGSSSGLQSPADGAPGINIAVAQGSVLCGDLGCEQLRRFTTLGELPVQLWGLERAGRRAKLAVVANGAAARDGWPTHELRLHERLVVFRHVLHGGYKQGKDDVAEGNDRARGQTLYEVIVSTVPPPIPSARSAEWLYAVEAIASQWDRYNTALLSVLRGDMLPSAAVAGLAGHSKQLLLQRALRGADATPAPVIHYV